MRLEHVLYLGVKELWSVARDPVMIGLIVITFTLSIYSESKSLPETLNRATIGIVDEDQSPVSARITSAFRPPYFTKPSMLTPSEVERRMDAGLDTFAVTVPNNFQRDLLAGRRPEIQLNVDATRMSQALNGSGYVQSIIHQEIQDFVRRYRAKPAEPVELVERVRFNPELNKSWFGAVMKLINQVTMLALVLTGAALIRERERGTIEHLLVMPVTPLEIMLSKIWSMGLVVLVACMFSLVIVIEGFLGVPIEGSRILFLVGAATHLFAVTSMAIFLATYARSMPQFGLLIILLLMPLQLLSGGSTPRESMPEIVQYVMLAAPTTHFVSLAQSVLYRGAGIEVVWHSLLGLALLGATYFAIALGRFRKVLGTMA